MGSVVAKANTAMEKDSTRPNANIAYLHSVGKGQEFVLDLDHYPEAVGWLADLVSSLGSTTQG